MAYRLALDHPGCVERLAVLDIVPTESLWERADARFALAFWPWSLLAQSFKDVRSTPGDFFPEEIPQETADALSRFFGGC